MIYQDGRLFLAGLQRETVAHPLRAPFDDRVIAEVHDAAGAVLDEALARGAAAQGVLRALPAWRRQQILDGVSRGIAERAADFEDTIVAEAGKPRRFARGEVQRAIATFALAADCCWRAGGDALVPLDAVKNGEGRTALVQARPKGLVVAITPFNFPLNLVAHKLAPAFAAGCPVVLKPAEQTPLSSLLLAQVCRAAGLPDGGLSVVPCDRSVAASLVVDDRPRVISFTGSDVVGWSLRAQAKKKDVLLELGGNAAVVVCDDLDDAAVDDAVARVVSGAFAYAGQVCISVQRVLVQRPLLAAFRQKLLARVAGVVCGDPDRDDVDVGPLIDDRAMKRVLARVDDAVAGGGQRLCGSPPTGRVLPPIVVEGAPPSSALVTDEIFGPVCTLEGFDDDDAAIAAVNASRFGLQAGVFTNDVRRVFRFAAALDVGAVIHDDAPTFRADHMPYGGVKDSGVGREGLPWAIGHYTQPSTLVVKVG
jgi:glyceraldehyde-3-phosphate dehydrogenase (NADP+)